jgi:SAM-dependent methyltransferase
MTDSTSRTPRLQKDAQMCSDPWLDRWLPLLAARAGAAPVLEIGCGEGADTVTLTKAGFDVSAFDLSPASVAAARLRAPGARIECRDARDPLPRRATPYGAVIASLSLHYFPWAQTTAIVDEIASCLQAGGLLLCRLNSTEDRNFGAGHGPEIEKNFHAAHGRQKRFFDAASVDRLFAQGWHRLSTAHLTTRKYVKRKALWEVVLEKAG